MGRRPARVYAAGGGSGGTRSGPVLMNRLLSLFELDFVLPGSARTVATLLGTHLSRHLRRDIHNLTLLRKHDATSPVSRYVPATTADFQRMYAETDHKSSRMRVTVSFTADGWGPGSITVFAARLTSADKEVDYTTCGHGGESKDEDRWRWVRVYRCAHPDVCLVFRQPQQVAPSTANVVRRLTYNQLQARFCNTFWTVYSASLSRAPSLGEVVTLPGDLMTAINPSRMDVPFSVLLSEKNLLDESILVSAVWEAALEVRKHAAFPAWYDGRKPFDVRRVYALPLYRDPKHPVPGDAPPRREHAVMIAKLQNVSTPEAQQRRARILSGAPFLLLMHCRAKTEMHIAQFFAVPQPQRPNEASRVYRLCKVDCGHNVAQGDNLWNIDAAVDVLTELRERLGGGSDLTGLAGVATGFANGLASLALASRRDPERELRLTQVDEGIHMGQVLAQRCVLESMRDVGLEVWQGSDLVPGQEWSRYVLLTAPLSVLAARAEMLKMKVPVNAKHAESVSRGDDEVQFENNFEELHFLRGTPLQRYRAAIRSRPHRYANYYGDFTLYQRLELIIDLVTRERAHQAGSDVAALRSGGADLNPLELVAEGVLEQFLAMHVPHHLHRFNAFWARLPESLTRNERTMDIELHKELRRRIPFHRLLTMSPTSSATPQSGRHHLLHKHLSVRDVTSTLQGDLSPTGIHIRYGHEDGEEGLTNGRSKSRRTLSHAAIGDAVRVDDQVYIGDGDTAGAMFSEETGLALKPLQRAPKPPLVNRSQPLRAVREYFGASSSGTATARRDHRFSPYLGATGPTIAFYFLWLEYYTQALLTPCLLGASVEAVQLLFDPDAEVFRGVTVLHLSAFAYSFGVMIWSSLTLEMFELQQSRSAYLWDVANSQAEAAEPMRPGFISAMQRMHNLTDKQDKYIQEAFKLRHMPNTRRKRMYKQLLRDLEVYNELYYFPPRLMRKAYMTSIAVSSLGVLLVAVSVVITLVLPPLIFGDLEVHGVVVHTSVSGVAQGIIIPVLNAAFRSVAMWLTEREHHRKESQHVRSLIVKLFAFQFVNSYGSLFYIGFYLQDMTKLGSQLVGIMVTGQLIRIAKEHILGCFMNRLRQRRGRARDDALIASVVQAVPGSAPHKESKATPEAAAQSWRKVQTGIRSDGAAHVEFGERSLLELRRAITETRRPEVPLLLDEYLQLVVQFGFVAMFCAAFPLCAAAAFVTNVVEMRLDAHKFLTSQRPMPQPANGIGVWFPIMQLLSTLAVITNTVWIYLLTTVESGDGNFSSSLSNLVPSLGDVGPVVFAFALEHLLIILKWIVRSVTPDVPADVAEDNYRERYFLLKEAEFAANEMSDFAHDAAADLGAEDDDDAAAELMADIQEVIGDGPDTQSDTEDEDEGEGTRMRHAKTVQGHDVSVVVH